VKTIIDLQIPKEREISGLAEHITSFSVKTLLHAVNSITRLVTLINLPGCYVFFLTYG
jgi:hypothetical protein